MANNITSMTKWVPELDELYRLGSITSILDSREDLVKLQGSEFKIAKMTTSGLANHNQANGGKYVTGDVNLTWETKTPTYKRNRKFTVDAMDDYDTEHLAFGQLAGHFIKESVIPEIDAVRFSKYAQAAIGAGNTKAGAITDATVLVQEIVDAVTAMEENEVPMEKVHLFITPSAYNTILTLPLTESKQVFMNYFENKIHKVPTARFYTKIDLLDGVTSGQEEGGYKKAADAEEINFLIVASDAIIQGLKHVAPKFIPAAINQEADGDGYAYRVNGVEEIFDNKLAGIFVHTKA